MANQIEGCFSVIIKVEQLERDRKIITINAIYILLYSKHYSSNSRINLLERTMTKFLSRFKDALSKFKRLLI